jgi:hypothetical protein
MHRGYPAVERRWHDETLAMPRERPGPLVGPWRLLIRINENG